ncbi:hypothetical protein SAMN05192563_10219 [Paraburkholderia aspalathi]|uniref:Uncharacterized protein n=1 Tax=Paraburkholderia aspalathi TaxID=1324617 RepID=A0A1I7EHR6_9BURK|nr:hypothetical protein SAMN05192563_10219 [Paraburkholderia aspalathi]
MEMVQGYAYLLADHLAQWVQPMTAMPAKPQLVAIRGDAGTGVELSNSCRAAPSICVAFGAALPNLEGFAQLYTINSCRTFRNMPNYRPIRPFFALINIIALRPAPITSSGSKVPAAPPVAPAFDVEEQVSRFAAALTLLPLRVRDLSSPQLCFLREPLSATFGPNSRCSRTRLSSVIPQGLVMLGARCR